MGAGVARPRAARGWVVPLLGCDGAARGGRGAVPFPPIVEGAEQQVTTPLPLPARRAQRGSVARAGLWWPANSEMALSPFLTLDLTPFPLASPGRPTISRLRLLFLSTPSCLSRLFIKVGPAVRTPG